MRSRSKDVMQLVPTDTYAVGDLSPQSGNTTPVADVVFVVHGIRDKGYWTRKIARVVVRKGRQMSRRVVALAPTYGYFAMLPFLFPWTRRAKVEWLLDLYVTVKCWHPGADVSFIGHSNGTYILAGAVTFMSRRTDQERRIRGQRREIGLRVGPVYLNRGTPRARPGLPRLELRRRRPIGWWRFFRVFCRLLAQDVGGAGHDGFTNSVPQVRNVQVRAGAA